jgi:peptidoglycan hydrolase-like protein with peptidoglycan-binding domain
VARRGSALTLAALCALTLAGGAGILGYTLRPADPPELLNPSAAETQAPVASQPFDDTRKVQVRLVASDTETLTLRTAGTLTAALCETGGSIDSGSTIARVNDRPIIGLHTALPLYRDLTWGDKGTDVEALQQELVRLGHLDARFADGWYGWNTSHAVQRLRVANGAAEGGKKTRRSEFVWLPADDVTGLACELNVGDDVTEGTAFATAEGTIERLEVVSMPESLTPGDRTLTVNGVTGPASESGVVDDATFLARILDDEELVAGLREDPEATVPGDLALADTIDSYTVPVGAIIDDGDERCVQVGADTRPVDVLGSALGSTVIVFPDADTPLPDTVAIGPALTESSCGE